MDYWWKENRRFVLCLAAGIGTFLLWKTLILSPLNRGVTDVERSREMEEHALQTRLAGGVPSEETIDRAERDLARLRQAVDELVNRIAFPVDLPRTGIREQFQDMLIRIGEEIRDLCVKNRVVLSEDIQRFGFPPDQEGSEEIYSEWLMRLAALDRVLRLAIEAQIDRMDTIDACHGTEEKGSVVVRKGLYLNSLNLRIVIQGSAQSVFKILHGLQMKGSYLRIERFSAVKTDPHKDTFTLDMVTGLLLLDKTGTFDVRKEPS